MNSFHSIPVLHILLSKTIFIIKKQLNIHQAYPTARFESTTKETSAVIWQLLSMSSSTESVAFQVPAKLSM
jgi:hypothetical protein